MLLHVLHSFIFCLHEVNTARKFYRNVNVKSKIKLEEQGYPYKKGSISACFNLEVLPMEKDSIYPETQKNRLPTFWEQTPEVLPRNCVPVNAVD